LRKGNPHYNFVQIFMVENQRIINAFAKLGDFFRSFCDYKNENTHLKGKWNIELNDTIILAGHHNGWFTEENILFALKGWGELLTVDKLTVWLSNYPIDQNQPKTVAIIMAGNIPLVGFHDFLAILITGNRVLGKLSSKDKALLPFISRFLMDTEPILKDQILFTENKLEDFDAIIATGSTNTARYFEYYFSKKPHIIRRNRNSVAVLTGKETQDQLAALGEDVFRYYGLGCRSVSKIFVPPEYDFDKFFTAIFDFNSLIQQNKYANNYDYNKAVYLMSEFKILENGFLMLKEDSSYASPIASLFYETYTSCDTLKTRLVNDKEKIQCIVASGFIKGEVPFGATQHPNLTDYADDVDTVDFLLKTSII